MLLGSIVTMLCLALAVMHGRMADRNASRCHDGLALVNTVNVMMWIIIGASATIVSVLV